MDIEINIQFEQVLSFVNQTNQLIFLTGKAGTGKTTLLKYIKQKTYKQMATVAPTGVAAINAGGSTIHSFFQFAFTPFLPPLIASGELDHSKLPVLKYNSQRLGIFRNLELLVIDEVSMVRADMLDQIDITLRQTRKKWHLPFGGVQVMLIGDMYQLPPVIQNEEWRILNDVYESPFFFDSLVIKNNPPVYIELEKIYRQNEQTFIDLLNKVRNNILDYPGLELLNSHFKQNISQEDYRENITLTTHNKKAEAINLAALNALPDKEYKFKCKVDGLFSEKNYPAEEELVLKKGTRVMFLKNNNEKNYYNGKTGVVSYIDKEKIKVKCEEDKQEIEVQKEAWSNVSYKIDKTTKHIDEEILGTFNQYPLRLAWAITIHKSQGLTFDKLIIDAAEAFSSGQVYVALSRCRGLKGLTLSSKISPESLMNDKKIVDFASGKHNNEQVNSLFGIAQKKYIKTVLSGLFDFTEIKQTRAEIAGLLQLHKNKINADGFEWAHTLFLKIDAVSEVSSKFQNQLNFLMEKAVNIEQDQELQSRINKAAIYFENECEGIVKSLKDCSVRTESKEAATDLNESLQKLFEDIYQKKILTGSCKKAFIISDFVKSKLQIKYPDFKVNIYATAKNTKVTGEANYPQLYRELILLRDEICNEEQKPIFIVAGSKTIIELTNYLPVTEEDLLKISGFGEAKISSFGNRFLSVIKNYAAEHNLESNMAALPSKKQKKAKKEKTADGTEDTKGQKINTKEETYKLYKQGLKLEEIAQQRGFALSTIEGHLTPYIESGDLNVDYLVSREKQNLILKALTNFKKESGINPIKNALPENISYSEIRYMVAFKNRNSG
jgi:hypothetical protein